jgi:hypothetical protein
MYKFSYLRTGIADNVEAWECSVAEREQRAATDHGNAATRRLTILVYSIKTRLYINRLEKHLKQLSEMLSASASAPAPRNTRRSAFERNKKSRAAPLQADCQSNETDLKQRARRKRK